MRNNSKNQNNQLPNQVEAEITYPFNPKLPSSLMKERIIEINKLCYNAQINDEGLIKENEVDVNSLVTEACAVQEIYEKISDVGEFINFYYHINSAFQLLLVDKPDEVKEIFKTYRDLTSIFRVIEKQKKHIHIKWSEANQILSDLDTLECEELSRLKGARTHD